MVTIQTLAGNAQKMPENKHVPAYLEEYGAIFGQAIRKALSKET